MPYAGDLSPTDAYRRVADGDAVLVDVRTAAEWQYVGTPDLTAVGRDLVRIEWLRFPGGTPNDGFLGELEAAGVGKDTHVLFLCRSGVRSVAAAEAATAAGWSNCYNVLEGFEGNPDAAGHRGTSAGWKASGLPWRQS